MSRTEVIMKESLEKIKGKINTLEKECDYLRNELAKYKNKEELTFKFDREMRRRNILIHGIPCEGEEDKRDLYEKVQHWFKEKLVVNVEDEPHIDDVIRLGSKQKNNRPVLVKFTNCIAKYVILQRAKLLTGQNYSITEDFSYEIRMQRKKLIPFVQEARKNGHFSRLIFDKIIIYNQAYSYEQLMEKRRNVNPSTSRLEKRNASAVQQRYEPIVEKQEASRSGDREEGACAVLNSYDSNSSIASDLKSADSRPTKDINKPNDASKYQGIVHDQEYLDKLSKSNEGKEKSNLIERLHQGRILRSKTLAGTFSDDNLGYKKDKTKSKSPTLKKWLNSPRK